MSKTTFKIARKTNLTPDSKILKEIERNKSDMPGIGSLAKNLGKAVISVAKTAVTTGEIRVSAEEQNRRMEMCKACKTWYREQSQRCSHPDCGCYMRVKTWLVAQHCPVKKW